MARPSTQPTWADEIAVDVGMEASATIPVGREPYGVTQPGR